MARELLVAAARAEQAAERREEAARMAAEQEAARLAAEAARLADEEARRAVEAEQARRERAERAAILAGFRGEADAMLQRDFLAADGWFDIWETGGQVTRSDFDDWKAAFVLKWVRTVLGDENFDIEQARAVATTSQDLRLVARAGSGKTRTIVTRAAFLQRYCRVDPRGILLVAFNKKAVEEITKRLRTALPGMPLPHVVTFHALAYALLRPEQELVFDDEDAETLAQSSKVQAIVDDLLLSRPGDVRRAMLGLFADDWKSIRQRGLHMTREEFFESRVAATRVTLGGEYVKSFGERVIANVLFEHDVDYKYERNYTRGGFNYRPDFTVLVGRNPRVVIEYFGMGDPQYLANADKKRVFWASQTDVAFAEFNTSQIVSLGEDGIRAHILAILDQAQIPHRRLSDDEIWKRVRKRAVDTFSKALKTLVNRARQLNLRAEDIRQRMYAIPPPGPDDDTVAFLQLAAEAYEEYLARSKREGFEDFTGVMWGAAAKVRDGQVTWTRAGGDEHGDLRELRFIHVDEFQDFSEMFMEFIQAIRLQAPRAVLCCVGDDWQAINRFAGADLRFFEEFEHDFPTSTTRELVTNYRSSHEIVTAGNTVMHGHGEPARPFKTAPGKVHIAQLADFEPTPVERHVFPGDIGTPALLRLLQHALSVTEGRVAVLFRRNSVPWFTNTGQGAFARRLDGYLTYLRKHFTDEGGMRLEVTTAHKYKGREADFVVVADADATSYPLIHPTAALFEVFGDTVDTLTDADRRLFYVATTRAETSLCYLVSTDLPSPFLGPLTATADPIQWRSLPIAVTTSEGQVEIRIYDAFEVKDVLKDDFGFQFDEATKAWYAFRPAEGFDFDQVQGVLSFVGARMIEVRDETQRVIRRAGARSEPNPHNPF